MSTIKLVISDLHLADGVSILDCFGPKQQLTFALVTAQDGVATDAHLCVWEGGANGGYRRIP